MKKSVLFLFVCFVKLQLTAQSPEPPKRFVQELIEFPTMTCCPQQDGVPIPVLNETFTNQTSFNATWHTAQEWNINPFSGKCIRMDNFGGKEPYYYSENNVRLSTSLDENGQAIPSLHLLVDTLIPSWICTENGITKTANYSAGMIWSKQQYKYGKFEVKFKLPEGDSTEALWPAFWLWNGDEIDVMEAWGFEYSGQQGTMGFSSNIQNGPGVNPGDNNLAWLSDHGGITKGVWHTIVCDWNPYKITILLNNTVIREFYKYYQICGTDTVGFDCKTTALCGGKMLDNISFPDRPMAVIFNMTLQPTFEWWGREINKTRTALPAIAEVAYIKVTQLKLPGSTNNLPNTETIYSCQDKDFCTTRFRRETGLLEATAPSLLCSNNTNLELESTWQLPEDPKFFECNKMAFTATPPLNATFDCNSNKAFVNIHNPPLNTELSFQLIVPKNTSSPDGCISEAGRIIKHTFKYSGIITPFPVFIDNAVVLTPLPSINKFNIGSHNVYINISATLKYWWEYEGKKYFNIANLPIIVKNGTNTIKLFVESSQGCISQSTFVIKGSGCYGGVTPEILLDGNSFEAQINCSAQNAIVSTPGNHQFKFDHSYLTQNDIQFTFKLYFNDFTYLPLIPFSDDGIFTTYNVSLTEAPKVYCIKLELTYPPEKNYDCPLVYYFPVKASCVLPPFDLQLNGKLFTPSFKDGITNINIMNGGTHTFTFNASAIIAAGHTFYFTDGTNVQNNTTSPVFTFSDVNSTKKVISLIINKNNLCEEKIDYVFYTNCYVPIIDYYPLASPFYTNLSPTSCNRYNNKKIRIRYNYEDILNSNVKVEFYDANNNAMLPISDDGKIKEFELDLSNILFDAPGLIVKTFIGSETCSNTTYCFERGCMTYGNRSDILLDNAKFYYLTNLEISDAEHQYNIELSNFINNKPVKTNWRISLNGNILLKSQDPVLKINLPNDNSYLFECQILLENGDQQCYNFYVKENCSSLPVILDQKEYAAPEMLDEIILCPGTHFFKLKDDPSASIVTYYLYKNNILQTTQNGGNLTFEVNSGDLIQLNYSYVYGGSNCGPNQVNKYILLKGEQCFTNNDTTFNNCFLALSPNPGGYLVNLNNGSVQTTNRIVEVNVFNKYNIRQKHIPINPSLDYNLDVSDLPNNDFYIVEIKDDTGNLCRKMLFVAR